MTLRHVAVTVDETSRAVLAVGWLPGMMALGLLTWALLQVD